MEAWTKTAPVAHRRTEFAITVPFPCEKVAPLFGAERERLWAEGWAPRFLHPQPARDEAGAVFTVDGSSVWITTIHDPAGGHVQYACFSEGAMATRIDIRIRTIAPDTTQAVVVYERTALGPEANALVNRRADADAKKGPEWQAALERHCARS